MLNTQEGFDTQDYIKVQPKIKKKESEPAIKIDSRVRIFGENKRSISSTELGFSDKTRRQERLKGIYEKVLCRFGNNMARELYNNYFLEQACLLDVKEIEKEMEVKQEKNTKLLIKNINEGSSNVPKRSKSLGRNLRRYASCKDNLDLSPLQRRDRMKNYGRWFIEPKRFSEAYEKVKCTGSIKMCLQS